MGFKYPLIVAVLILASVLACSRQIKPRTMTMPTEVAKVRVSRDGKTYFNERVVSLDELRREFQRLGKSRGAVSFVDESSGEDSWQLGQAVKKAIVEAQLPIKLR